MREEVSVLFLKVDGLYIDGKKDATLVMTQIKEASNIGKSYLRSITFR